jgi:hypothetical protein
VTIKALTLAILLGATTASPEDLLPADRAFTALAELPDMRAYRLALRDALLGGPARHTCEALVVPSFQREWAVYVQNAGRRRQVVTTEMESQLWDEMHRAAERPGRSLAPGDLQTALRRVRKDVRRSSAPLTDATAALVEQACAALLARAELPLRPRRCIDGVSYHLFQPQAALGARGGLARCPSESSAPGRMLAILEELRAAAGSSGEDLMRRDMALARKATQLLLSLDSPGAGSAPR